jgi:hypothetical protein
VCADGSYPTFLGTEDPCWNATTYWWETVDQKEICSRYTRWFPCMSGSAVFLFIATSVSWRAEESAPLYAYPCPPLHEDSNVLRLLFIKWNQRFVSCSRLEQKHIFVCLVHQLIFIQYGRKLMPLQEAPILRSLFLRINVEAFQHIRATKELWSGGAYFESRPR